MTLRSITILALLWSSASVGADTRDDKKREAIASAASSTPKPRGDL